MSLSSLFKIINHTTEQHGSKKTKLNHSSDAEIGFKFIVSLFLNCRLWTL